MVLNKRTPAFLLGFFFFILPPLFPDARETALPVGAALPAGAAFPAGVSVFAETGTLLLTDDGSSAYWRSGLNFAPGSKFYLEADLGGVSSNLPALDGSPLFFREKFGFNTDYWSLGVGAGFFGHRSLGAETEKMSFSSEGGRGAFFGIEAPFYFGPFTLVPSFSFGEASWSEGELYWFFGRPDIPSAKLLGLTARLEHSIGNIHRAAHELSFRFLRADMKILSNEREHLFDSELEAGLLLYRAALETGKSVFTGTVGWLWAGALLEGELTASNQHYFLFPYLFYNVKGSVEAAAGFAALGVSHSFGIFEYQIDLGALHVFSGASGGALVHYKQKRLFGGGEVTEKVSADPGGIGAAFLRLRAALPALPPGAKSRRLYLGLEKIFVVPWGLESFSGAGESSGTAAGGGDGAGGTLSLVRTALLSGLSIRASFSW